MVSYKRRIYEEEKERKERMEQTVEIKETKFFRSRKIFDNVTLISCIGGAQCYLVEGKERALLIDGLTGVGSLRSYVRELTDLPVLFVVTHGHFDHAGAAYEYGECFIHPADIELMYSKQHSDRKERLGFTASEPQKKAVLEDVVPECAVKTYPVYEGDVFELGDFSLEVIEVPGHTRGTIVLLDRVHRVVYSGDACNANTLLGFPGSASIEEYLEALQHFQKYETEFDVMWGGHGGRETPKSVIEDGIRLCQEILARTDDKIVIPELFGQTVLLAKKRGENYLPLEGGYCNIVYTEEGLHKKAKQPIQSMPNQE